MHPINGYPLHQVNLKDEDLKQVLVHLNKINAQLESIGIGTMPLESIDSIELIKISQVDLVLNLKPYMIEMGLVHPKVELTTEYLQIKSIIEKKIPDLLNQVDQLKKQLEKRFQQKFKETAEEFLKKAEYLMYQQQKLKIKITIPENYLSYSDFKPFLEEITGDDNTIKSILDYQENFEIKISKKFQEIKNRVLSKKTNMDAIVKTFGKKININLLKEQDFIAYEYLRSKALSQVALNNFEIEVNSDKTYEQRVVKPQDSKLAQILKLKTSEIAIFAISVDPIKEFGLEKGQELKSTQMGNLTFLIQNKQSQIEVQQEIKLNLSEKPDDYVVVVTPVYISYIKAELVKNQQNQSVKKY